ncbi:MAG: Sapep family Mn(2+)-dependent dipeptidase [Clostridiales bacterium]|nr:Sapep family Mn(2+)-dependent dipeptidase [Clostridiales bacterium]
MISIPSVGGDPEPGCPYGKTSREVLARFLKTADDNGFRTGTIDDKVGYLEFGKGKRLIGIVCHLDVVPAGKGWSFDPFKLTESEGRLYGRGIVDDKGPACASFFAMKRLMDSGFDPDCRIRLILGTDEERTCDCVETYAAKGEIPDFAITPDGEYPVIFAEKGILHITIKGSGNSSITAAGGDAANMVPNYCELTHGGMTYEATGKISHASKPDGGINAITELISTLPGDVIELSGMLRFINDSIKDKDAQTFTGCDIEDISGIITYNPAILKIGPDEESLVIDIRYPVTSDKDEIISHIASDAGRYGLTVIENNYMAPLFKDSESREITVLTKVWSDNISLFDGYDESYKDKYLKPIAIGGGTYARHMPNTIAFGIQTPWSEDQCHRSDESISINDLKANIKVLTEAIIALSAL